MEVNDVLSLIPKLGDLISSPIEKGIQFIAGYGYKLSAIESRLILIFVIGFGIYLLLSIINTARKVLKWGLIVVLIFLAISVAVSIFA